MTDAPATYHTARRPGQSGGETEHRAGPNPRSAHPTGPNAPYEPWDREGIAAEKHHSDPVADTAMSEGSKPPASGTIKVVDLRSDPLRQSGEPKTRSRVS
ncbi:MAG TPA: hypothetical protein VGN82_07285 [Bosea sp. (in: a-proteobacteria)]|uniref:hypothetical protein n=1 Tax=Bosea sp. (in: a-proteobacteria) TaxID=1871050 RepID=UPI002E1410A5|nr:hypothetical protein [Bosea sp. (in: a-proteobacteria)]